MKISIKNQLEKKHMTRCELARNIGITYPAIDNIYKERTNSIRFDTLEDICRALDCTPNDILIFDDTESK